MSRVCKVRTQEKGIPGRGLTERRHVHGKTSVAGAHEAKAGVVGSEAGV